MVGSFILHVSMDRTVLNHHSCSLGYSPHCKSSVIKSGSKVSEVRISGILKKKPNHINIEA